MNDEEFRAYLKKRGKKDSVIERNVETIKEFRNYLVKQRENDLDAVSTADICSFVKILEKERKTSAKGYLYVLMNYFKFTGQTEILGFVTQLREERTKKSRRVFPLKEFYQVNEDYIKKLDSIGIKNVEQMLEEGKTIKQRKELSQRLDIPEEDILRLVELSDITRIGYVKSKLAVLYHSAGFDSPTKFANFTAEELYKHFEDYIQKSNWDGMVPNLADLKYNLKNAKKLKEVVEK